MPVRGFIMIFYEYITIKYHINSRIIPGLLISNLVV